MSSKKQHFPTNKKRSWLITMTAATTPTRGRTYISLPFSIKFLKDRLRENFF